MKFHGFNVRTVHELVFVCDDGTVQAVEISKEGYDRLMSKVRGQGASSTAGPSTRVEYESEYEMSDDIMEEMNERLSAMGLPLVGDDEADGVEQL